MLGLAIGAPLFLLKEVTGVWSDVGLPNIHFTYMAMGMCALAVMLMATISLLTAPPSPEKIERTTSSWAEYKADLLQPRETWVGDVRLWAAGLVALIAATVIYFW